MDNDEETVYIGVGSNINPKKNIIKALNLLQKQSEVAVAGISSFYSTVPINRVDQDNFLNGIFEIRTTVAAESLKLNILGSIEIELERERNKDKFASRTIDLDILVYGDLDSEALRIPDPDIYTRNFIAVPLRELNPRLVLPDSGKTISDLPISTNTDSMQTEQDFTELLRERIIDE
jgi:2-amino-4-hydroxy-6-hydroxymethyldihydropteridine diphosphokinase